MLSRQLLDLAILLLIIPRKTLQVTIHIGSPPSVNMGIPGLSLSSCINIAPGVCCRTFRSYHETWISIENLLLSDVAAVWTNSEQGNDASRIEGCSGRPSETRAGPFEEWSLVTGLLRPHYFVGGSYISLRSAPPTSNAAADWLTMQGIRGLAWGDMLWEAGDHFISYQGHTSYLGQSQGNGLWKRGGRHLINRGTAYLTEPLRWEYPSLITVNGTNYTDNSRGDLIYSSDSGSMLNVSDWG